MSEGFNPDEPRWLPVKAGTSKAITPYARESREEYFAETMTAYRYEKETLARVDPAGHAFAQSIFKATGLER